MIIMGLTGFDKLNPFFMLKQKKQKEIKVLKINNLYHILDFVAFALFFLKMPFISTLLPHVLNKICTFVAGKRYINYGKKTII